MLTAMILAAALVVGDGKDLKDMLLGQYEKLDVPGKGEPEYTDAEAAAFAERLEKLQADRDRKPSANLKELLGELKVDPKKMRGGFVHIGNATDWVEYRLSPNYTLTAAYMQQAPRETAFRGATIAKVERVKPK